MATQVATLAGTDAGLTEEALDALRMALRGELLTPSDPGYAGIRPEFNAMHAAGPGLVVQCTGTADVVAAVNFAREQGLKVAVRGGGHSIAGLSSIDRGMLIDLAPMNGVQVDAERRLAHVQGGALWGDLDHETQQFGLIAPGGVVSDTGVAGLTLGGGYGWVRRKYGLSSDHVVEAQVVCADGEVRTASADSNPDLYWAIRGGGGNFGIVTSFTFSLEPLGPTVAFAATFYPVEEAPEILRAWRDYCELAPNEVTSVCVTITFPANPEMPEAIHDRPCIIVGAVHTDADV
jgi:FAD/FMN-containing dehydrogenase